MKIKIVLFLLLVSNTLFLSFNSYFVPFSFAYADVNAYYPFGYNLIGNTQYVSGWNNLQTDDSNYTVYRSYESQTSPQTLYAHQETITIAGASYYLLKLESADSVGTSLYASIASIGRQLWGKFVYPLAGVTSIPTSTWTFYYRIWHSSVPEDVSTNSPSSVPVGTWTNPTYAYASDNVYATTATDGATQQYGNYGFNIPSAATITKVEVGYEAYTAGNEKIGITLSWDSGTTWATEIVSAPLGTTDPNTVTWVDFTATTSWTPEKLSNANFRARAKGVKVGAMSTVYLDWIPARVTYISPPSAHADVDIFICRSDGTIRETIATNVANSGTLSTTAQTLSGAYAWSAYTVINQTDYLEIDYYVDVTTAKSGVTAYLIIDDNTLAIADQTRATNIMLPSEFTMEVEFTGSSNTYDWTQLVWTVDSAWTIANATITLQLYNYTLGGYPTSGNGYISYTSSPTPNTDETKNQTITTNPTHFRDSLGNWKIKVKGVKSTTAQFDFKGDLVKFEVTYVPVDTVPPTWSNAGTNNTLAGQITLFYVKWTDNFGLCGFIFGTNNTGTWQNDTWTPMSGTTNWSNVTKILNSAVGVVVQWRVWANDTSNNWNATQMFSLTASGDTIPPTWSNAGTNSTLAGNFTLFHVKWTDNVGLSGFIFGTNNTGTWVNETWTLMTGLSNWSNVTKVLNSTVGIVVQWQVWANDTSNNWNITGILSLTTTRVFGYALNLRIIEWDLIDPISNAYVYKDSDVKVSDANGWANWTQVSGTVQIKVKWYGFWVNGTFSISMDADKAMDVRCNIFDIIVTTVEGLQGAILQYANITVFNATSIEGNKIRTGTTGSDGKVVLANVPNSTLTFTVYDGASPKHVIANVTRTITIENQTEIITCDQNYVSTTQNWSIVGSLNNALYISLILLPEFCSLYVKSLKERIKTVRSKQKIRSKEVEKDNESLCA